MLYINVILVEYWVQLGTNLSSVKSDYPNDLGKARNQQVSELGLVESGDQKHKLIGLFDSGCAFQM